MNETDVAQSLVKTLERIAMVLGALFASNLGEVEQNIKIERLRRCGFTNMQIASILGTTANTVNVALHRTRRRPRRKNRAKVKRK